MSETIIQDLIAARLVLPNRITVPLHNNIDVSCLQFPVPCVSVLHDIWDQSQFNMVFPAVGGSRLCALVSDPWLMPPVKRVAGFGQNRSEYSA